MNDTDFPLDQTIEISELNKPVIDGSDATINAKDFDPYKTDQPSDPSVSAKDIGVTTILPAPDVDSAAEIDGTVAFADIDQTIALDPAIELKSVAQSGGLSKKTVPMTTNDQTIELAGGVSGAVSEAVVPDGKVSQKTNKRPSVMHDANIMQTINPRELSAEDAAFWGDISRPSSMQSQPSRLSPAINRSLSETKLHLRDQTIAAAESHLAKQSDYRLVRLLGKGGMGNVYVARQGSLDRIVALKVIKPLEEEKKKRLQRSGSLERVEQERRLQFISEAVVTGDLDHPNIVPIHDIAVTGDNTLFYSMKRVSGKPWSKVIDQKTRDENIDILLKVCDAIAFAHTRGVVHRDIKPENIMLGEFGVVMVMDWGLALAKPEFEKIDSVHHSYGLGGSPAYMAPEMAIGPVDRIGPASDIYLLGATLFQIITSWAPHHASNVSECLKAVANNTIRETPKELHGELLEVALKAMATRPEDRYRDVISFQQAIRDYRSHSESIALASRAIDDLHRATQTSSYEDYARSLFGFEKSITLWAQNTKAIEGLALAKLQYAEAAKGKGDFDLGLSLLSAEDVRHQPLIKELQDSKKERLAKNARLSLLRNVAAAMLAFIIVGGSVASYMIYQRSVAANEARQVAEDQRKLAEASATSERAQKLIAEQKEQEAVREKMLADVERNKAQNAAIAEAKAKDEAIRASQKAIEQEQVAVKARELAETEKRLADIARAEAIAAKELSQYESYVASIGLAKARIDRNEFNEARRILIELKANSAQHEMPWEWRWLWKQTTQAASSFAMTVPVKSLVVSQSNKRMAWILEDGTLRITTDSSPFKIIADMHLGLTGVSAIAFSPEQKFVAIGTESGDIEIWSNDLTQKQYSWIAHKTTINKLHFIDNQTLVSASDDNSIKIWDTRNRQELGACWNLGPVKDTAVSLHESTGEGKTYTLVAAIAESTTGRAVVWKLIQESGRWNTILVGENHEHSGPVLCVDISTDGEQVLSGDNAGNVMLWQVKDAVATDYRASVKDAIASLSQAGNEANGIDVVPMPFQLLVEPELDADGKGGRSHDDRVRVVRFSRDGKAILTGGDDYVVRLWNAKLAKRTETLRGHGGWILDARFIEGPRVEVISSSADATVKTWAPKSYISASSENEEIGLGEPLHREEILSARLNQTGDAIVTASRDRTAIVFKIDLKNLSLKRMIELRDDLDSISLKEGTQFVAQSAAIDRDNGSLYIASADGIVRVWDLNRGTERFQIQGAGLNPSLALSADGRYLLTRSSSNDTKSILWRVDPTRTNAPVAIHRLKGHAKEAAVTAIAVSSDGSRLFTADNVGIGVLWDGTTGKPIGEPIEILRGYRINSAAFLNSRDELLVGADDQQLTQLDLNSRAVIRRFPHNGYVTSSSLSANKKFAITVSERTTSENLLMTATLWNLANGSHQVIDRATTTLKTDQESRPRRERIASAQFGTTGQTFSVAKQTQADGAGRMVLWSAMDSTEFKPIQAFDLPSNLGTPQFAVPLSNDRILTLNGDAGFQWLVSDEPETKASHLVSYRANAAVHHANFSSDGRYVVTGSHSLKVWDIKQERAVAKIESPHEAALTSVCFSPKNNSYQLVTGGADGAVKLFEFDAVNEEIKQVGVWFEGEATAAVRRTCFSNDGAKVLSVGDEGTIRLINLATGRIDRLVLPEAKSLLAAAFSTDGRFVVVGGQDSKARLWDMSTTSWTTRDPVVFTGHAEAIQDIRCLTSGENVRVLTVSGDKSLRVWDPRLGANDRMGREILNLRQHAQGVTSLDTTSDGDLAVTAGRDASVVLWPANAAEVIEKLEPK